MKEHKTASVRVTIFPTPDHYGKVRTSSLMAVVEGSGGGGHGGSGQSW
jgi:hypothetical protein